MGFIVSIKQIKKTAREILFRNYRSFLFATLFFIALSFGFTVLSSTFGSLLCVGMTLETCFMVSLSLELIGFIVCFPFFIGYTSFCTRTVTGEQLQLSELFGYYSGEKLGECYAFLLRKIPEFCIKAVFPFVLLSIATKWLPRYLEVNHNEIFLAVSPFIPLCCLVLQILTLLSVFYLAGGMILSLLGFCLNNEHRYTHAKKRSFFILRISFIPLYVFSVFSFGVLFIAYTVPMVLISFSLFITASDGNLCFPDDSPKEINIGDTALFDISRTKKSSSPENQ